MLVIGGLIIGGLLYTGIRSRIFFASLTLLGVGGTQSNFMGLVLPSVVRQ
jgi:hypothetical protein